MTAAQRQRVYRQKRDQDPLRRAVYLKNEQAKYQRDKQSGKKKTIAEKTPRQQRKQRKLWRANYHIYAARQKLQKDVNNITPPSKQPLQYVSRQRFQSTKKAYQAILSKNQVLEETLGQLSSSLKRANKKSEKYKKRLNRSAVKYKTALTPRSKTKQLLKVKNYANKQNQKAKSKVKRTLEYHFALLEEIKSLKNKKHTKKSVKEMSVGIVLRKYKLLEKFRSDIHCLPHRDRACTNKGPMLSRIVKQTVKDFFLQCDTSKIAPGKRDTITRDKVKKQRRILCDTMPHLYKRYISSCKPYISFTSFYRLKPFWVVSPRERDRQTCACKKCENINMLALALWRKGVIQTWKTDLLIQQISCSKDNKSCMYNTCQECKNLDVIKHDTENFEIYYQ